MTIIIKHSIIWTVIIIILLSSTSINVSSKEKYDSTEIEDLIYKQEIQISIDTSIEGSKFQPIDIHVDLNYPCWAKNENEHSVRVCYEDGSGLNEIESQIYDLEFQDETHIKSCNIVFLIPVKTDGSEKYYLYYDSSQTDPPDYTDHIILEDTDYFYEPIPGQKIEFDYYGIREDGNIIYGIIHRGEFMGNPLALSVIKFKLGTHEVEPDRMDQLGIFDMRYGIYDYPYYYGSSWSEEINKKIVIDGNLMVRMRIDCTSPNGVVKSDDIYTYYYCPSDTKRLIVNVNHEVLKTQEIEDPTAIDGAYTGIVTIKARSASIKKLNVGIILPQLNVYGEDKRIKEFEFLEDPDSIETEYILTTRDDCDLGEKAWVSLSNPSSGKAHGLIFNSNSGIVKGEEDGIQVKAFEIQNVKLPGLEADSGTLMCTRNAYEKNEEQKIFLTEGFNANFDVEFISFEKGSYESIDSESELFQTLIKDVPLFREDDSDRNEKEERYSLTAYVHFAPSIPLGPLLSAGTGKPFPYIHAELYKNNNKKASGSAGRISLRAVDFNIEGLSLIQKIKFVLNLFDLKSISFFKKIIFPDLEAGNYVIKIFKENPLLSKERQYIGFAIIELKNNKKIHINCRPESSIKLSIFDQNNKGIENVRFLLENDNEIISDALSDKNGNLILKAPFSQIKPYILKVIYQGFLIDEKKVNLGITRHFIPLKESYSIQHYKLNLKLKDNWDFAPDIDVNPVLTSNEMIEPMYIQAQDLKDGEYLFKNLIPAEYTLSMGYKSFDLIKDISIDNDQTIDLIFPAEYELNFDIMSSYGEILSEGILTISRNGKIERQSIDENGKVKISIPPGNYNIVIYSEDKEIAKQKIEVKSNKKIDILTSQETIIFTIIFYLSIVLAIISILYIFWKKQVFIGLRLFVIAILIISLISPWWTINGDNRQISTTTKTLLIPPNIVTLSSSSEVLGGDVSQVPSEVTLTLGLISYLIIISCLIIFITIFIKNKLKKTTKLFSILSIVLLIICLSIFFYVMSQIAEVGVGGFIGNGNLEISLPGLAENEVVFSNWGPGSGFYLILLSLILLLVSLFQNEIKK